MQIVDLTGLNCNFFFTFITFAINFISHLVHILCIRCFCKWRGFCGFAGLYFSAAHGLTKYGISAQSIFRVSVWRGYFNLKYKNTFYLQTIYWRREKNSAKMEKKIKFCKTFRFCLSYTTYQQYHRINLWNKYLHCSSHLLLIILQLKLEFPFSNKIRITSKLIGEIFNICGNVLSENLL